MRENRRRNRHVFEVPETSKDKQGDSDKPVDNPEDHACTSGIDPSTNVADVSVSRLLCGFGFHSSARSVGVEKVANRSRDGSVLVRKGGNGLMRHDERPLDGA